jgi:hypothetical protein
VNPSGCRVLQREQVRKKKVTREPSGRMSQAGAGPPGQSLPEERIGANKVQKKRKKRLDAWSDHAPELGPFTFIIYNQEGYLNMLSF